MIRLLIADDHAVLRQALGEMLSAKGEYQVIAEAANGVEFLQALKENSADVVILDLSMPLLSGLEALRQLKEAQAPHPPILVLSADEEPHTVRAAFEAGASGFVPKNAGVQELEFAISSVLRGNSYLSPHVTAAMVARDGKGAAGDSPANILTKRELEIMVHLADGKPNREIGKMLHISTRTVDTHRTNILRKLNLRTNAELVKLAIGHGLIKV
jgi:DNA-binding NarL/FixJ family response regulator